jgi:dTDP-4-dehydrorhamnose 3,5-epimerase
MIFRETKLAGVFEISVEPKEDERGFFARTWCRQEFLDHGLNPAIVQCNISFNARRGTLRGIHFQFAPYEEAKLVRCTRGKIFDLAVDLRPKSSTFRQWIGAELSAENRRAFYVPEGCGHGFLTLEENTEVFYQMSVSYHPESSRGVRWNDPALGIVWPSKVEVISERDRTFPDLQ